MKHTIGAKWHRVCIFIHYVILILDSGSLELLEDFSSLVASPPRLICTLFSMIIVSIVSCHLGAVKDKKKRYMCKAASCWLRTLEVWRPLILAGDRARATCLKCLSCDIILIAGHKLEIGWNKNTQDFYWANYLPQWGLFSILDTSPITRLSGP